MRLLHSLFLCDRLGFRRDRACQGRHWVILASSVRPRTRVVSVLSLIADHMRSCFHPICRARGPRPRFVKPQPGVLVAQQALERVEGRSLQLNSSRGYYACALAQSPLLLRGNGPVRSSSCDAGSDGARAACGHHWLAS
jgi:hypothetical protein